MTKGRESDNQQNVGVLPQACVPTADLLAAWVDGGLEGTLHVHEARLVARHVAECARCAEEVTELRAILADLHAALKTPELPHADDPAFWTQMAQNIDAAIAVTPQEKSEQIQPQKLAPVVQLQQVRALKWTRTMTWTLSGTLAAAALALMAVRIAADAHAPAHAADPATFAAPLAGENQKWTDALQARMSIEDDPASGDSDPIDDLEDLNEDEIEELATSLGEEG